MMACGGRPFPWPTRSAVFGSLLYHRLRHHDVRAGRVHGPLHDPCYGPLHVHRHLLPSIFAASSPPPTWGALGLLFIFTSHLRFHPHLHLRFHLHLHLHRGCVGGSCCSCKGPCLPPSSWRAVPSASARCGGLVTSGHLPLHLHPLPLSTSCRRCRTIGVCKGPCTLAASVLWMPVLV
jgi:hypothetical protein